MIVLGSATIGYFASETVFKDALSPDRCRWCDSNRIDRAARDGLLWADPGKARAASTVVGYVAVPIVVFGALAVSGLRDPAGPVRLVDDAIPVLEALLYTQLVTNAFKYTFARERPSVHFAAEPGTRSNEDNLSFISGHSSLTFAIAVGAGTVAHRRKTRYEPFVWGAGLALASATAYLRIAGDRHYLTDVLAGGAVGAAGGLVIPRLTGSLPSGVSIVPAHNGVSLAGSF